MRFTFFHGTVALAATLASCVSAQAQVSSIQYLGQATFPARSLTVNDPANGNAPTTVGGLSGISYDRVSNQYYILRR